MWLERKIREFCERWAERNKRRTPRAHRFIPPEGDIYLERHYIYPPRDPVFDEHGRERSTSYTPSRAWQLHLHHFHRSDADHELHNHPWEWGLSFILTGGYREERRITYINGVTAHRVERNYVKPFSFNLIRADDFHRVDLLDEKHGCWTLFLTGPRQKSWGFWDRYSGVFTPWNLFTTRKSRREYGESYAKGLRGQGVAAVASSPPENWIPDDHAAPEAAWNGDDEAFEKE